jgi:hypothetical protein
MLARIVACSALLLATACAAALPGYVPPSPKHKSKLSLPWKSGDIGPDGRYAMSDQEKAMDCKRTTGSMLITINRLKHRNAEIGTSEIAKSANKVLAPFIGGSSRGLDREVEYTRDRARLIAYNEHLAAKGCATVDIEAELARPPEPAGKKY